MQTQVGGSPEKMATLQDFAQHCAYVPAIDAQFPTLTCRQVLTMTARILCADSEEDINERVEALLDLLGLQVCADTKVGGYVGMKGSHTKTKDLKSESLTLVLSNNENDSHNLLFSKIIFKNAMKDYILN